MDASFNAVVEYWTRFAPSVTGLWDHQRSRERAQGSWGVGDMGVQWEAWGSTTYQEIYKYFNILTTCMTVLIYISWTSVLQVLLQSVKLHLSCCS